MTIALLCSGQGRQDRTMFDRLAQEATAGPILDIAGTLLGRDVPSFLAFSSKEELHANVAGQILCVTRALAAAAALYPDTPPVDPLVAGYSVGEIAAWGVAGVWSAADTLRVAKARALAMDAASCGNGGLGYVRGLTRERIEALCRDFRCMIAIVNPERLFVVGGPREEVQRLCEVALAAGATRAAPIDVQVASHTSYLSTAVTSFRGFLSQLPARRVRLRLLSAMNQRLVVDPIHGQVDLARQIANSIDWEATLIALSERGVLRVLELGPGSALSDMARQVSRNWEARSLDDFESLQGARAWLR